jgi:hypothetical protein
MDELKERVEGILSQYPNVDYTMNINGSIEVSFTKNLSHRGPEFHYTASHKIKSEDDIDILAYRLENHRPPD